MSYCHFCNFILQFVTLQKHQHFQSDMCERFGGMLGKMCSPGADAHRIRWKRGLRNANCSSS